MGLQMSQSLLTNFIDLNLIEVFKTETNQIENSYFRILKQMKNSIGTEQPVLRKNCLIEISFMLYWYWIES